MRVPSRVPMPLNLPDFPLLKVSISLANHFAPHEYNYTWLSNCKIKSQMSLSHCFPLLTLGVIEIISMLWTLTSAGANYVEANWRWMVSNGSLTCPRIAIKCNAGQTPINGQQWRRWLNRGRFTLTFHCGQMIDIFHEPIWGLNAGRFRHWTSRALLIGQHCPQWPKLTINSRILNRKYT